MREIDPGNNISCLAPATNHRIKRAYHWGEKTTGCGYIVCRKENTEKRGVLPITCPTHEGPDTASP